MNASTWDRFIELVAVDSARAEPLASRIAVVVPPRVSRRLHRAHRVILNGMVCTHIYVHRIRIHTFCVMKRYTGSVLAGSGVLLTLWFLSGRYHRFLVIRHANYYIFCLLFSTLYHVYTYIYSFIHIYVYNYTHLSFDRTNSHDTGFHKDVIPVRTWWWGYRKFTIP